MRDGADRLLQPDRSFPMTGLGSYRREGGRPVFLHGMWRSGSTWLWSRFRAADGTCCFYEPLHHGLAKLTPARIARDTPEQIDANRHPALARPYFHEFAPLIDRRGVRDYREAFAYDRFVLAPHESHPLLQRYVSSLVDHAARQGLQAVLGFNRTGLRAAWLSARFNAFNVNIDRDPMAIWASYKAETIQGNYAFFSMWLAVLERNAAHPVFAPLVDRLKLAAPIWPLRRAKDRRRQLIEGMTEEARYFLTFYVWLACHTHATDTCDLVIDTRQADASDYRLQAAERIADETGLQVDLSGLRSSQPRMILAPKIQNRIEQAVREIFPYAALADLAAQAPSRAPFPLGQGPVFAPGLRPKSA